MPRLPKEPLLFLIGTSDDRQLAAVMALSAAEARDFYIALHLEVTRPTAAQAFALGQFGDVPLLFARPEYAQPANPNQLSLLGDDVVDAEFTPPIHHASPLE